MSCCMSPKVIAAVSEGKISATLNKKPRTTGLNPVCSEKFNFLFKLEEKLPSTCNTLFFNVMASKAEVMILSIG